MTPMKEAFKIIMGTGENAVNLHFFSPNGFLPFPKQISIFQLHF